MPNWCSNIMTVTGPSEDVKRFVAAARGRGHTYNDVYEKDGWEVFDEIRLQAILAHAPELSDREQDLCFHSLYPVPDDVRRFPYDENRAREIAKIAGVSPPEKPGYQWESHYWGVKWGACDTYLANHADDGMTAAADYNFETAWGPAMDWHDKVASDWPTLEFSLEYSEPGMGFEGKALWREGSLQYDDSGPIEYDNEEVEDDQ